MLIHAYVFLSTLFIGLQGAALYRHNLKNALTTQSVEVRVTSENQKREDIQNNEIVS